MLISKEDIMDLGRQQAIRTMTENMGGPFGAVIVKEDEIISIASNTVLEDHDPTAHAEINAIREAGKILGTHDLSGCELYATGYPCPMCLSAIIWANIKKVYFALTPQEAEKIGFRDDAIYKFLEQKGYELKVKNETMEIEQVGHDECISLFEDYEKLAKEIY